MLRTVLIYALVLALGTALLQWLDLPYAARVMPRDLIVVAIAVLFLGLGTFVGAQLFARRAREGVESGAESMPQTPAVPTDPASLGISPREAEVLVQLAQGLSNKEIARALGISPNTVKTHLARLYEKLGATRRVDVLNKARELGLPLKSTLASH